jgi:hypothetical protein
VDKHLCNLSNKKGTRFGTRNVRSLYRAGSFTTAARYKLELVGVQEVRWDKEGTVTAQGSIISFM